MTEDRVERLQSKVESQPKEAEEDEEKRAGGVESPKLGNKKPHQCRVQQFL